MGIIISTIPLVLLIWYFASLKKYDDVNWEIKKGLRCYSCKSTIDRSTDDRLNILLDDKEDIELCAACKRDEKIDLISDGYIIKINKFKNFIMFDKKHHIALLLMIGIFCILDILFMILFPKSNLYSIFGTITSICNGLFWISMILRRRWTCIKK